MRSEVIAFFDKTRIPYMT